MCGTGCSAPTTKRRIVPTGSPTVFNLGYTEEVARDYPWVKELSGGIASGHPRRRAMGAAAGGRGRPA